MQKWNWKVEGVRFEGEHCDAFVVVVKCPDPRLHGHAVARIRTAVPRAKPTEPGNWTLQFAPWFPPHPEPDKFKSEVLDELTSIVKQRFSAKGRVKQWLKRRT